MKHSFKVTRFASVSIPSATCVLICCRNPQWNLTNQTFLQTRTKCKYLPKKHFTPSLSLPLSLSLSLCLSLSFPPPQLSLSLHTGNIDDFIAPLRPPPPPPHTHARTRTHSQESPHCTNWHDKTHHPATIPPPATTWLSGEASAYQTGPVLCFGERTRFQLSCWEAMISLFTRARALAIYASHLQRSCE